MLAFERSIYHLIRTLNETFTNFTYFLTQQNVADKLRTSLLVKLRTRLILQILPLHCLFFIVHCIGEHSR